MTMWLPGPVYECLPYAYIVIGLLFVGGTIYTGPGTTATLIYGAAGTVSLIAGICVFLKRRKLRPDNKKTAE